MDKQQRINQTYDYYAPEYDRIMRRNGNFEEPRRQLFKDINFDTGDNILEIPVGTGLNLPLYPTDVKLTCLDLNNSMMKLAIEKSQSLQTQTSFLFGNARQLPFKDNAFDKAIIAYGLSAIPGNEKVLDELYRVVKSKGQIGIVDFGDGKESMWMGDINLESFLQPHSQDIISRKTHSDKGYGTGFFETYILTVK